MTLEQAARYVGLPQWQLLLWADAGIGPRYTGSPHAPSRMHYEKAELDQWMNSGKPEMKLPERPRWGERRSTLRK